MSTAKKDYSVPLLSRGGHFNKGDIQVETSLNIRILRLDIKYLWIIGPGNRQNSVRAEELLYTFVPLTSACSTCQREKV